MAVQLISWTPTDRQIDEEHTVTAILQTVSGEVGVAAFIKIMSFDYVTTHYFEKAGSIIHVDPPAELYGTFFEFTIPPMSVPPGNLRVQITAMGPDEGYKVDADGSFAAVGTPTEGGYCEEIEVAVTPIKIEVQPLEEHR